MTLSRVDIANHELSIEAMAARNVELAEEITDLEDEQEANSKSIERMRKELDDEQHRGTTQPDA